MAEVSSGSKTSNAVEGRSIIFEWSLAGQSIANNTSTISWSLKGAGSSGYVYGSNFNLTINGTKVVDNKLPDRTPIYVGTLIASGSITIAHGSDGKKSFSVSFDGAVYTYATSVSGSASWTLPTIPRASSFGKINGDMIGSAITINISRKASVFTHKVYYSFGDIAKTAINTNAGTSCSWTPSLSTLGAQIPNTTGGICTLYLDTYNGSTKIGNTVTKTINLSLPSSAIPSISKIAIAEANSTVNSVCPGIYLQSLSKLKITTTATGIYGSTIAKYSVSFEDVVYTGQSVTTNTVKGSGTIAISVTVTDSRGRIATKTQDVTIKNYSPPKLTAASITRGITTNTTVNCLVSGSVSSILSGSTEKNTLAAYVVYATSENYPAISSTYQVDTAGLGLSFENVLKSYTGLSASSSYYFRVIVKDKFNEVMQDFHLSTAPVIVDINKNGRVGIGKYHERGVLDVAGDIYASGNLYLNNKLALKGSDAWLRINDTKAFTSGVYFGASLVRTDGELRVGTGSSSNATIIRKGTLDLSATTPFIDFHAGNSTADYTSRIIDNGSYLEILGRPLLANDNLYLPNGKHLYGIYADGISGKIASISSSNNIVLGYGSYEAKKGRTNIYTNDYLDFIFANGKKANLKNYVLNFSDGYVGFSSASSKWITLKNNLGDGTNGSGIEFNLGKDGAYLSLDYTASDHYLNYRTNCSAGHWFDKSVSAPGWVTRSTRDIKTNIVPFDNLQMSLMSNSDANEVSEPTPSALEIINDSQIYQYDLIDEVERKTALNKHYGFVIGEGAPKELLSYDVISKKPIGIDLYSMASIVWQAIKELTTIVSGMQ